jgi:polyisoprenoid-binding protein YceI
VSAAVPNPRFSRFPRGRRLAMLAVAVCVAVLAPLTVGAPTSAVAFRIAHLGGRGKPRGSPRRHTTTQAIDGNDSTLPPTLSALATIASSLVKGGRA